MRDIKAVLGACGIDAGGAKHLPGLRPGTHEGAEPTVPRLSDPLQGLNARGLTDPLRVAADGAPGLIPAAQEALRRSSRRRCLAHKPRKPQAKGRPAENLIRHVAERAPYPARRPSASALTALPCAVLYSHSASARLGAQHSHAMMG
ncbi:MAG: transposase [Pseudomonadota bacterium]